MTVQMNYTGWLYDKHVKDKHGTKFDNTGDHSGQPFSFPLGQGQIINGGDKGMAGMRVDGKRTLLIPAELGYGACGTCDVIPFNTSLAFDVKLMNDKKPACRSRPIYLFRCADGVRPHLGKSLFTCLRKID